jgi:hypothetical protein
VKAIGVNSLFNPMGTKHVFLLNPIEGWRGGSLPGDEYMSSKGEATFRLFSMDKPADCKSLSTAAAMAPAKIKNLKVLSEPALMKIGKNGFVANVGSCEGDGPSGPAEVHFAEVRVEDRPDMVWPAVLLVSYPKDASAELRNEAAAWVQVAEFKGKNGRSM